MNYVAGFMFDGEKVALIRKNRPEWQAGLLNGIGGKIEEGERPLEAMRREFREETGRDVEDNRWVQFAILSSGFDATGMIDDDWMVYFFVCQGSHLLLSSSTDEKVGSYLPEKVYGQCISNLEYLIPMARRALRMSKKKGEKKEILHIEEEIYV